MRHRFMLLAVSFVVTLGLCIAATAADRYKIDEEHTSVNFKITHVGISWVHGRFNELAGTVVLAEHESVECPKHVFQHGDPSSIDWGWTADLAMKPSLPRVSKATKVRRVLSNQVVDARQTATRIRSTRLDQLAGCATQNLRR